MPHHPSHTLRKTAIHVALPLMIITCFLGFGKGNTVLAEQSSVKITASPAIKFFYKKVTLSGDEMRLKSEGIAKALAIAVVKKPRTEIAWTCIYV